MENNLKANIQPERLPKHVAIIMDGNGRWAAQRAQQRNLGHEQGAVAVCETVEAAAEIGIEFLTLYAFSTENWNRPKEEVDALMNLLVRSIHNETPTLMKNNIRLRAIGDLQSLHEKTHRILQEAIDKTAQNTRMTLVLALSYSSRWEIVEAVKSIAEAVEQHRLSTNEISAKTIDEALNTAFMPDPDLLIRTSGEYRISNFLLWQLAYTELYFTDILWPDFTKDEFYNALINYQNRERRFGKTSQQLENLRT
ncbi:MAG: isoprenyl transferase [Bacteroidales bacterium]|jgi:undecaprenyl diphosphate synthase|nr:isoprenyl transferase [Bacteroidales bacterium]